MKTVNGIRYSDLEHMLVVQPGIHIVARREMLKMYVNEGRKEMLVAYWDAIGKGRISDEVKDELLQLIEIEDHNHAE